MSVAQPLIADSIAQALLAEFEQQAPITRRFLERLPEDKLTWKPHEKSMTAGQLAYHLASVPGGVIRCAQTNPAEAPEFADISATCKLATSVCRTLTRASRRCAQILPHV